MAEHWFRRLLRLYPTSFRREFGDLMIELFNQIRSDANLDTRLGRARFTWKVLRDFIVTASRAWLAVITHRHVAQPGVSDRLGWRGSLDRSGQDVRYALRSLKKRPGFTAVIVMTLSLGIGANTAIFTLVNEIVLRPLPIGNPSTVVDIFADVPGGNSFSGFSYPDYIDYAERNDVLTELVVLTGRTARLGAAGSGETIRVQFVSVNYFDLLSIRPAMGRGFRPEEGIRGSANTVAIVSHGYWQRRAGSDPAFLGSTILLNETPFTVIGITAEGFQGTFIGFPMELWAPIASAELILPNFDLTDRASQGFELMGRLKANVSISRAQAAFDLIARELESEHPAEKRGHRVGIVPTTGIDHSMRGGVMGFLAILMTITGLVLLITCLNVGNMLLARATARQKEMAIRVAMGARRGRLVRQLLTEALLLFALGGLGGALVAERSVRLLLRVSSTQWPLGFSLDLDWRVLSFTAVIALGAALLAGIFPAREALRQDPIRALRVGGDQDTQAASRLRSAFVVAQIAGAVVLLTGAGLFVRSLWEGVRIDPGFEADRVAATTINLPETEYSEERGRLLFTRLLEDVTRLPDVTSASIAMRRPIGVSLNPLRIEVPGFEPKADRPELLVDANAIDAKYLATLDIPILRGRDFLSADDRGPPVVIVNETMAARFWRDRDPVGQQFFVDGDAVQVVGVAADSRHLIQDDAPMAHFYVPLAQNYSPRVQLLVRSDNNPLALRSQLQAAIDGLDPSLPPIHLVTPRETINASLVPQRVAASVTATLGLIGLLLAALGVYGIVVHAVGRRTKEIGIRMALGSSATAAVGLVLSAGMKLVIGGVVLGTALSLAAAPLLRSFLVGVHPADPLTIGTVIATFLTVASIACYLPARRATKIDPTTTLRWE